MRTEADRLEDSGPRPTSRIASNAEERGEADSAVRRLTGPLRENDATRYDETTHIGSSKFNEPSCRRGVVSFPAGRMSCVPCCG